MVKQRTLKSLIRASGVGLHTGQKALPPTPASCSAASTSSRRSTFQRAQLVGEARLASTLIKDGVKIHTVEHLMSALAGLGIDNVFVDLDAPELPIMDGSASPSRCFCSRRSWKSSAPRRFLRVRTTVEVRDGDKWARLEPHSGFRLVLDRLPPPGDRAQHAVGHPGLRRDLVLKEIARARTFGFMHEVEDLKDSGLALASTTPWCSTSTAC